MTTKTVYQCDGSGVYIGPATSYESPLEPGIFLLPAGCVEMAPPDIGPQQAAQWDGSAWSLMPDHRGEAWYMGQSPVVIDFVGNPREHGLSLVPVENPVETTEPSLAELRVTKLRDIVAKADALLVVGAPAADLHVALYDSSRQDMTAMGTTALAAASGSVPWPESYSRGWITIENIRIPLATPADGLALAASVGNYYAAIVQHRRDLKDAALAAPDVAALDEIDIATGWPT